MTSTEGSEWVRDFSRAMLLLSRSAGITLKKRSPNGRATCASLLVTMIDIENEVVLWEFKLGLEVRPCSGDEQLSAVLTVAVAVALEAWGSCLADRIEKLADGELDTESRAALARRREDWVEEFAAAARYDWQRLEIELQRRRAAAAKSKASQDDAERLENEFWEFRLNILLLRRAAASLQTRWDDVSDKQREREDQDRRERLLRLINRAQLIARARGFHRDQEKIKGARGYGDI